MNNFLALSLALCCLLAGACDVGQEFVGGETSPRLDAATPDAKVPGAEAGGDAAPRDGKPGSDAIQGCNPKNYTLTQKPPAEVFLVLDRSGSMVEKGSTPAVTKWQELTSAVDFVLQQFETSLRFGLMMYPSDAKCTTPGPQVPVGLNQRQAVLYYLKQAKPAGGTPTFAALNNAASSMISLGGKTSRKYIVLATDGGPNCNYQLSAKPKCSCTLALPQYCCTSHPQSCFSGETCLDEQRVLKTIKELHDKQQITTYVVGLEGSAQYKALLNSMAKVGGAPQKGATTDYYKASSKSEVQAALKQIAVQLISCEIDLGKRPDYPNWVLVYIDGKKIPRDTKKQNGWDYTDASLTKIMLYGSACKMLQDGKQHKVTATFACVPT